VAGAWEEEDVRLRMATMGLYHVLQVFIDGAPKQTKLCNTSLLELGLTHNDMHNIHIMKQSRTLITSCKSNFVPFPLPLHLH
jgi:hypothetical protein